MRVALLVPAALAAVLSGCVVDGFDIINPRFTKDFHYSYPLKAGGRLSIESFNGAVELSGWDQDTVDISGTKYGPSESSADSLKIVISDSPDSVSVRVERPSERHGGWGARFAVKMPRKAVLDLIKTSNGQIRVMDGSGPARLRTSNGAIRVQRLEGGIEAQTSNGSVELTDVVGEVTARTSNAHIHIDNLKGPLQASTSNGGITANLAAAADRPVRLDTSNAGVDVTLPSKFANDLRVSTSNGHITVHLPQEVNARVVARTSNASIKSDYEVRMQGDFNKNHLEGVIGSGGPLLDLNTSNAAIRLLRM